MSESTKEAEDVVPPSETITSTQEATGTSTGRSSNQAEEQIVGEEERGNSEVKEEKETIEESLEPSKSNVVLEVLTDVQGGEVEPEPELETAVVDTTVEADAKPAADTKDEEEESKTASADEEATVEFSTETNVVESEKPTGEVVESTAVDSNTLLPDNEKQPKEQEADPSIPVANSKGAQILMNRFSTWTQTANQRAETLWKQGPTIQKNAQNLWKQAPNLPVIQVPKFPVAMRGVGKETTALQKEELDGLKESLSKEVDDVETPNEEKTVVFSKSPSMTDSSIGDEEDEVSSDGHSTSSEMIESIDADADADINSGVNPVDTRAVRVGVALSKASAAASKASAAASVVAESVATGFRGRYSASTEATPPPKAKESGAKPLPESQTSLILKSRAGKHMQDILDKLENHEFAMLLGSGMLGVNLKQCYLKNHGIFIDFLVPGGQAELSGIIRAGDLPVRLGDIDFRKGTILEIPQQISKAKRPVVLILASGTKVSLERMSYIDVAVAMMHRAREFYNKRGSFSILPSASPKRQDPAAAANSDHEGKVQESIAASDIRSVCDITVPVDDTVDSFVTPPAPTLDIRKEFLEEVPLRCFDKFVVSGLCEVADLDSNFRAAVRNAFLACAIDSRRLPFLARHLSSEDELLEGTIEGNMTPSAQLMLFLELMSFLDLYSVTPVARLRDVASRVAYKFFLPTKIGQRLQPPLFDFHHIVPDSSLRHLEFVLSGKSQFIPRDVFLDFQKAVVDSLTGTGVISFLASSECARMRGYLRNTAPYVNLPLRDLFDALVRETKDSGAKNSFAYILLFLICQLEKEPNGEHNFGNEEENNRLLGASNDLCCAIFIEKSLVPTLNDAKARLEEGKIDEVFESLACEKVVKVCEIFWDTYIAGTLEISSKSSEIEAYYKEVRSVLEKVAAEVTKNGAIELKRSSIEAFVNSKLVERAKNLADELLYNYAANTHTKFREHKFHEWMCIESSKVRASDPNWSNKQELPALPQGCIKRLLRKADLPEGVSSHKPYKASAVDSDNERRYPNAEYAVVFGSSVGSDLASQMPIPGIESSDIRRYTCLPVALDREHEFESFQSGEALPATFESYAIVPPSKQKPFAQVADERRVSSDGWDVSLVSFTIPNAESSGDIGESALYGVSLFFQRKSAGDESVSGGLQTNFVCEGDAISEDQTQKEGTKDSSDTVGENVEDKGEKDGFRSPISFDAPTAADPEAPTSDGMEKDLGQKVQVSSKIPKFNDKVHTRPWAQRAVEDEFRDHSNPLSIGLALVSRRNVILAMRDTLSRLLFDYSRNPENVKTAKPSIFCGALVNVLGGFSHKDVESTALQCILEPYLKAASLPWIERPIAEQAEAFETLSLHQLTSCLPPTPLALMFVTALLEQKIVLSSSRRSVLHSASVALAALLRPLKWTHLLVPFVPAALATDLIQYPAPFILGISSEEDENRDLLGSLPTDVTLIDLDVGRVILAPSFGQDNEMVRRSADAEATARALRSQVLYLAQALGSVFGASLRPETWCCDSPSPKQAPEEVGKSWDSATGINSLRTSAQSFIDELLQGVTSCCYWIEEVARNYGASVEPTVLFDEDKFFGIKNQRASKACTHLFPKDQNGELALSLDDFDLVLESFLRCQSMSSYISSRPKTEMVYY